VRNKSEVIPQVVLRSGSDLVRCPHCGNDNMEEMCFVQTSKIYYPVSLEPTRVASTVNDGMALVFRKDNVDCEETGEHELWCDCCVSTFPIPPGMPVIEGP